jgi:hypothetical protein
MKQINLEWVQQNQGKAFALLANVVNFQNKTWNSKNDLQRTLCRVLAKDLNVIHELERLVIEKVGNPEKLVEHLMNLVISDCLMNDWKITTGLAFAPADVRLTACLISLGITEVENAK